MNKTLLRSFLFAILASLFGCSTSEVSLLFYDPTLHTTVLPTKENVLKSNNSKQIYKNTVFYSSDFNESGNLKKLFDFNYAYESSPCTVIGNNYIEKGITNRHYYTVNINNQDFLFVCQFNNGKETRDNRRLYLVGTLLECQARTYDFKVSLIPGTVKDLGTQCNGNRKKKTKTNLAIESLYNDIYKNNKVH